MKIKGNIFIENIVDDNFFLLTVGFRIANLLHKNKLVGIAPIEENCKIL